LLDARVAYLNCIVISLSRRYHGVIFLWRHNDVIVVSFYHTITLKEQASYKSVLKSYKCAHHADVDEWGTLSSLQRPCCRGRRSLGGNDVSRDVRQAGIHFLLVIYTIIYTVIIIVFYFQNIIYFLLITRHYLVIIPVRYLHHIIHLHLFIYTTMCSQYSHYSCSLFTPHNLVPVFYLQNII